MTLYLLYINENSRINSQSTSTLAQEATLGEWLLKIVHPCCQVWVCVCFDVSVGMKTNEKVAKQKNDK